MTEQFQLRLGELTRAHEELIHRPNEPLPQASGWFQRYRYPVLTAAHAPLSGATISIPRLTRFCWNGWP